MIKKFFLIFIVSLLLLVSGALAGLIFFYFFKEESVFLINKFKLLQGLFGIHEYREGMSANYVFLVIFFGNLISTGGYFALGYLKALIPVSLISGFFIMVFLLSGIIRHKTSLPMEVIILSSTEMFYRMMALSIGEYIQKNKFKNKATPIVSFVIIFLMFLAAVFYESFLIFR